MEVWKRRQSLQASGGAAQTHEASDGAQGTMGMMNGDIFSNLLCQ